MGDLSDDSKVIAGGRIVGFRCTECGKITTEPNPMSINGWHANKGSYDELELVCLSCNKK